MKHGARNDLPAKVPSIKRGGAMCQMDVELEGTAYRTSSVMTNDSLDAMNVKEGDRVHVVAKAIDVLLTKE